MTAPTADPKPVFGHHLRQERAVHPALTPELALLLLEIGLAGKIIAREVSQAALTGRLGYTGDTNVQGERVKQLDQVSNEIMVDVLRQSGLVSGMVSEEMEQPVAVPGDRTDRFVVCFDPVDGSSNTDINGIVGTIFGVRRAGDDDIAAALAPGTTQVAAGYVMYGPAVVLVYTAGHGVHGLTLDLTTGEYRLTHPAIRIPRHGKTYSVNEGNQHRWGPAAREAVAALRSKRSLRYVGALVADFHRTLLEGGIFLYPAEEGGGKAAGKLRLLYEAAPLGLVAEEAGGSATTGTTRILDIAATEPHQRVSLVLGSPEEVGLVEGVYRTARAGLPQSRG